MNGLTGIFCKVITKVKKYPQSIICVSQKISEAMWQAQSKNDSNTRHNILFLRVCLLIIFSKLIVKNYIMCDFRILYQNCKSKRVLSDLNKTGPKVGITVTCRTYVITFANRIKNNSCSKKFHHFPWLFSFNYLNEIQNSFNFICHQRCYSFVSVVNYLKHPFSTAEICKSNQRDGVVLTWNKPLGASAHFSWKVNVESDEMGNIFN